MAAPPGAPRDAISESHVRILHHLQAIQSEILQLPTDTAELLEAEAEVEADTEAGDAGALEESHPQCISAIIDVPIRLSNARVKLAKAVRALGARHGFVRRNGLMELELVVVFPQPSDKASRLLSGLKQRKWRIRRGTTRTEPMEDVETHPQAHFLRDGLTIVRGNIYPRSECDRAEFVDPQEEGLRYADVTPGASRQDNTAAMARGPSKNAKQRV